MNMKQRLFHIALGGALVLSGAALRAWTEPDSPPAPPKDIVLADEIKTKRLTIVDANGDPAVVLKADNRGGAHHRQGVIEALRLALVDSNGYPFIVLEADDLGGAHRRQGKIEAQRLSIVNGKGDTMIGLSVSETGGAIGIRRHPYGNEAPTMAVLLDIDARLNGSVSVWNSKENPAARLGVKEDGSGVLERYDGKGGFRPMNE